jgi:hypothetical protein
MKALAMSMSKKNKKFVGNLSGGIDRKPLTEKRIKELNRMKREEIKKEKELREWKKFAEETAKSLKDAKEKRAGKLIELAQKAVSNRKASK